MTDQQTTPAPGFVMGTPTPAELAAHGEVVARSTWPYAPATRADTYTWLEALGLI